jgi:hypothetical protein
MLFEKLKQGIQMFFSRKRVILKNLTQKMCVEILNTWEIFEKTVLNSRIKFIE